MTAISSPFEITYGSQAVGGDSGVFQLDGPYREGRDHDTYFLEFEVQVVGTSLANLQSQCDTLEAAFRKRDQNLTVDMDQANNPTSAWTYTAGEDLLNVQSSITKGGDPEEDHGITRNYSIRIEGELPSLDTSTISGEAFLTGLRDIQFAIDYASGRSKTVTVTGTYTGTPAQTDTTPNRSAQTARQNYEDTTTGGSGTGIDSEWTSYSSRWSDTFELIDESVQEDRNTSTLNFSRIYRQLLDNQSAGTLDDTDIRDHTFSFSESFENPGDFDSNINRLRTVVARFDCAVDVDQNTTLATVINSKIKPHIVGRFVAQFSPKNYAVTNTGHDYDRTSQRASVTMTFLYQKASGSTIVEQRATVRLSDSNKWDITPMLDGNKFAADVQEGYTVRTRETIIVSMIVGEAPPGTFGAGDSGGKGAGSKKGGPIALGASVGGPRGGGWRIRSDVPGGLGGRNRGNRIPERISRRHGQLINSFHGLGGGAGGQNSDLSGWIVLDSERTSSSFYIGTPDYQQILMTEISERIVEMYTEAPSKGT